MDQGKDWTHLQTEQVDTSLFALGTAFGDNGGDYVGTGTYNFSGASGVEAYAADAVAAGDVFNDAGFRELIQKMDDADVPGRGREVGTGRRNTVRRVAPVTAADGSFFGKVIQGVLKF